MQTPEESNPEQSSDSEQPGQNVATPTPVGPGATGPRTERGKQKSKRNALKHGIFSKVVLLRGEPLAEYSSLLRGLRNDLEPVGALEEILVDKLAALLWRHRRLIVAEGGEIRKRTEFLEWDEKQLEEHHILDMAVTAHYGGLLREIEHPRVLDTCLDLLQRLKKDIEDKGFDEENDKPILRRLYGESGGFGMDQSLLTIYFACQKVGPSNASYIKEMRKQIFLEFLTEEVNRLEGYKRERGQIEPVRRKVELLCGIVPDSPALNRLLKYEITLERNFDRTLNQLERAQRMRRGQPVLPPINVNVSGS